MFQYPFEHGAIDHLHPCGSLISADAVESASVRTAKPAFVCHQEWNAHRNSDTVEPVCEPRFLVRKASPSGRVCLLLLDASYALASLHPSGEVRPAPCHAPRNRSCPIGSARRRITSGQSRLSKAWITTER